VIDEVQKNPGWSETAKCGYPGAAPFTHDEETWRSYVLDSLIETVVARDVLQMQTVTKPALLRQLFGLCAQFPSETLSYTKMLGQSHACRYSARSRSFLKLKRQTFALSFSSCAHLGHLFSLRYLRAVLPCEHKSQRLQHPRQRPFKRQRGERLRNP
jgi:hypothetical protein